MRSENSNNIFINKISGLLLVIISLAFLNCSSDTIGTPEINPPRINPPGTNTSGTSASGTNTSGVNPPAVIPLKNTIPTFRITNVANLPDDARLELDNVSSLTTLKIGGITYLFVAGDDDDGVSVFTLANDGSLNNVTNINNDGDLELWGARSITTHRVGNTNYLFVAGFSDNGVSIFSIADDGNLFNVDNLKDNDRFNLRGPHSVTAALVGNTNYLFIAGFKDNGVSVFSLANDGSLNNITNINDSDRGVNGAELELNGAMALTTALVGTTTYLIVAGSGDDGISVFSVEDDGNLVNVFNVDDGMKGINGSDLQLDGASAVTTAKVGTTTYLIVAGSGDGGISIFSLGGEGNLANLTNVNDNDSLNLSGAASVNVAQIGNTNYLFVGGGEDDGVSIFSLGDGGSLRDIININDADKGIGGEKLQLGGVRAVTTVEVGGTTYLIVGGGDDNGISIFQVVLE